MLLCVCVCVLSTQPLIISCIHHNDNDNELFIQTKSNEKHHKGNINNTYKNINITTFVPRRLHRSIVFNQLWNNYNIQVYSSCWLVQYYQVKNILHCHYCRCCIYHSILHAVYNHLDRHYISMMKNTLNKHRILHNWTLTQFLHYKPWNIVSNLVLVHP